MRLSIPVDPTVSTVVCGTWGVGGCYPVFNAFSCPCAVLWRLSTLSGPVGTAGLPPLR